MKQSEIVKEIEEFIKEKFNTYGSIEVEPRMSYIIGSGDIIDNYSVGIRFNIKNE